MRSTRISQLFLSFFSFFFEDLQGTKISPRQDGKFVGKHKPHGGDVEEASRSDRNNSQSFRAYKYVSVEMLVNQCRKYSRDRIQRQFNRNIPVMSRIFNPAL